MFKLNRIQMVAFSLCLFSIRVFGEVDPPFDYSKTWRIIYFQGDNQFVNQRPVDYNPNQGFIFIYEILEKYVGRMQPFSDPPSEAEIKSLGIWTQLYLVNDAAYKELFLGDHTLSDAKGWVLMTDGDYLKLSQLLIERKNKTGDPFDGDKDRTLKNLLWKDNGEGHLDDFATHFHPVKQSSVGGEESFKGEQSNGSPVLNRNNSGLSSASSSTHVVTPPVNSKGNASRETVSSPFVTSDHERPKAGTGLDNKPEAESSEPESNYEVWLLVGVSLLFLLFYFMKRK